MINSNSPEYSLFIDKLGLDKVKIREDLEFVNSLKGMPTAKIGNIFLHSKYDPVSEAKKIVAAAKDKNYDCWVFGGFGFGYHIEALLELDSDVKIIIAEPDPSFPALAAQHRDLLKIITSEQVYIAVGAEPETAAFLLSDIQPESVKYFQLASEYNFFPEYFDKLKNLVNSYLSRKEVNFNTLKRFGKLWVKNLSKNLNEFALYPGLKDLEGKFSGLPALILAGGPSLDSVIPFLPQLKEKYLIIAVDTSFNAAIKAGVVPDAVVVVDPQYWNSRHLDRCEGYNSLLVSEPSTYPGIFRYFKSNKFFSGSIFPLGQYFESITFSRGKIGAGGSVATSAWDLARQIGCSKAVFAGLDLGYPGSRTHFKGSFFEERAHTFSKRVKPAADMDFSLFTDASLIPAENSSRGSVFTDKRLLIYIHWFEEQLKMHNFETVNLSAGGVKIEGMKTSDINEILQSADIRNEIDVRLDLLRKYVSEYKESSGKEIVILTREALLKLYNSLKKLAMTALSARNSAKKILIELNKGKDPGEREIQKLLSDLDIADNEILSESSRNVASFLLQEIIKKITKGDKEKTFKGIIEKSVEIYTELESSLAVNIKYLELALKEQ